MSVRITFSVDEMIAEVDIDGDGRIDFDGMYRCITKFFYRFNKCPSAPSGWITWTRISKDPALSLIFVEHDQYSLSWLAYPSFEPEMIFLLQFWDR